MPCIRLTATRTGQSIVIISLRPGSECDGLEAGMSSCVPRRSPHTFAQTNCIAFHRQSAQCLEVAPMVDIAQGSPVWGWRALGLTSCYLPEKERTPGFPHLGVLGVLVRRFAHPETFADGQLSPPRMFFFGGRFLQAMRLRSKCAIPLMFEVDECVSKSHVKTMPLGQCLGPLARPRSVFGVPLGRHSV